MIELVACPTNVISHHVMNGTIRIANCAFKGSHIEKIELPYTLEEIGTNAFYFANNLHFLELPKSIRIIEPQKDVSNLSITYNNLKFDSWKELFSHILNHGFELKDHKYQRKK